MIFPSHRLHPVRVIGEFVEYKTSFNTCTLYLLKLRFTFSYKNQYSVTVEFFHAFKLPSLTALVIMRQKPASYAGTIICQQRLLFIICTIYSIHVAVVVDVTSSKKSHYA